MEEIESRSSSDEGIYHDFCDGSSVRSHPLFSKNPETIILAFYYDELEVANPLGSKRGKHKLGLDKKIIFNVTFTTILCTM